MAPPGGEGTAFTATDLQGDAGRGPETGPQSAETHVAQPGKRPGQRAPDNPAQHGPSHPRRGRAGRPDLSVQGRTRDAAAPPGRTWPSTAGATGVYPQERRET